MLSAALILYKFHKDAFSALLLIASTCNVGIHLFSLIYPILPSLGFHSLKTQPTFTFYSDLLQHTRLAFSYVISVLWIIAVLSAFRVRAMDSAPIQA